MECYVCHESDWRRLDGAHSKSLIQVCKKCGSLCHDVDPSKEKAILDYYRREYKTALGVPALVTANNKLRYLQKFLAEFLQGKSGLVCGDIGAATGYSLNWLRRLGHRVTGSELVVANRRMSEHFFGVPLTEELSDRHQYDLLIMYHVLEHLIQPDRKLARYVPLLKEGDGRFLISTPFWLGLLEEQSGSPIAGPDKPTAQDSFDNLYHKNHINLFTPRALQNLLGNAGLVASFEDFTCYGQTYILRRGPPRPFEPEDWQEVERKVLAQKRAIELLYKGDHREAVKAWPLFPEAWMTLIFGVYGKDPERQADMLQQVPKEVRSGWRFLTAEADWLARMERLEDALGLMEQAMRQRFQAEALFRVAEYLTRLGRLREANIAFSQVAELQPHRWGECYHWIIRNATQMPTWQERGEEAVRKMVFEQAMASGTVKIEEPGLVGGEAGK